MGFLVTMLKGKKGGVLSFNGLKTFCTEPAVPCGGMGMRRLALEEGCVDGRRAAWKEEGMRGRKKGCETSWILLLGALEQHEPQCSHTFKCLEQCSAPSVWSSGLAHRRRLKYRDDY